MSTNQDFNNLNYNLEQVYDDQISPLMQQIIQICQENDLPMIFGLCYGFDGLRQLLTTSVVTGGERMPASFRMVGHILNQPDLAELFVIGKPADKTRGIARIQ